MDGDTEVNVLGRDGMGAESVLILDLSQPEDDRDFDLDLGIEFNQLLESYE